MMQNPGQPEALKQGRGRTVDSFKNAVAIITGGASGIGAALAQQLLQAGAGVVVLADIDEARARELAQRLGPRALPRALDVRDAQAVQALVDEVAQQHGRLDLMFNNAGVGLVAEARDLDLAHWRHVLDINLRGVVHGVAAAYPRMVQQKHGHIINTASIAGLAPTALGVPYAASKHAVVGLSTSLRAEAAALGVRVSVACPGLIETPLIRQSPSVRIDPVKAFGVLGVPALPADRCAQLILQGIGRNRGLILVTWQARLVWWIARLAPEAAIHMAADLARKMRALRQSG